MLNPNTITRGLLATPLLAVALALVAAPDAAAVRVLPDGDEPAQLGPAQGAVEPAPAVHGAPNGLDWSDIALAAALGLAVFAITALAVVMAVDRRRAAPTGDRTQPLPRF